MKVAITGATGFIGSWLSLRHKQAGDDVVALGRIANEMEKFRGDQLHGAGLRLHDVSINDKNALTNAIAGSDAVYHLAAAQHEANVPDQHFWDVNVEGTRNVLDACVSTGVRRLVHGSTIGVYGSAMDGEIDETSPTRPENIYGVTKLEGENLARQYTEKLDLAIIRISETYGPGDGRLLKLFKAIEKRRFFTIGRGDNIHQLIYVDDLARGLITCAENPAAIGETFVLAGTERLKTDDMCRAVADAVGTPMPRWKAPMWPFMLAAIAMEKTLKPMGIQPPLHRRRLDFFRKSFFFDQSKVQRTLSFSPPVSFAEGTVATAKWYRENGLM